MAADIIVCICSIMLNNQHSRSYENFAATKGIISSNCILSMQYFKSSWRFFLILFKPAYTVHGSHLAANSGLFNIGHVTFTTALKVIKAQPGITTMCSFHNLNEWMYMYLYSVNLTSKIFFCWWKCWAGKIWADKKWINKKLWNNTEELSIICS